MGKAVVNNPNGQPAHRYPSFIRGQLVNLAKQSKRLYINRMATHPRATTLQRCALVALVIATASFAAPRAAALPLITEFLADNESVLADEDGTYSDWIEIFNPDGVAADLSGYYLTDDATMLTKWQIPATTMLGPSNLLVIFASDKDRAVAGSELRTNFKINDDGEYLAVVAPDGTLRQIGRAPCRERG